MMRFAFVAALALSACHPRGSRTFIDLGPHPEDGPVVAVVGSSVLRVSDLRQRLGLTEPDYKQRLRDEKALQDAIDDQIRFELLTQAALRQGLDRDAQVQEAAKKIMIQKLLHDVLDGDTSAGEISDTETLKFYQEHLGDFQQPEKVRLSLIALPDRQTADVVFQQLKKRPDTFKKLQGENGGAPLDETQFWSAAELLGKLGASGARAAQLRELGAPALLEPTPLGFVIAKCTGRKVAVKRPLAEVSDAVKQRILRDKRAHAFDQYVARLRVEFDVTVVKENMAKVIE